MHSINTYRKIAGGRGYGIINYLIYFIVEKFEKLTRAEMKEVLGGTMVSPCKGNCKTDDDCKVEGETCKDNSNDICPGRMECS